MKMNVVTMMLILGLAQSGSEAMAAASGISVDQNAKQKINLSGRQRMLTQRIAKSACFIHLNQNTDVHLTGIGDDRNLYYNTLVGLRDGNTDMGLLPEESANVLHSLDNVDDLWLPYNSALKKIIKSKQVSDNSLADVVLLNVPALTVSNSAVLSIVQEYGQGGMLDENAARTINVAGRQRMLSQKAAKEFCLIVAGIDVAANRKTLERTVTLFEAALNALINGDDEAHILEPSTQEQSDQYGKVQEIWQMLLPSFEEAYSVDGPSPEAVESIVQSNVVLLAEMNRAVQMY